LLTRSISLEPIDCKANLKKKASRYRQDKRAWETHTRNSDLE
jgi:hypothetical protein